MNFDLSEEQQLLADTTRDDVVGYITGTKTMGVELIGTTNISTGGAE